MTVSGLRTPSKCSCKRTLGSFFRMAGCSSTAASAVLIRRDQSENSRLPGEILAQNRIQLYDYSRWARRRILTVASTLGRDDFIRPMGNSFSSIRDTLAHILGAEWIWLERKAVAHGADKIVPAQ